MKRRIERPLFDLQHILGGAFDGLGDGVAVPRFEAQRLENEEIELVSRVEVEK